MTKPALILLPGMPLDAALWDHQVRHLPEVADVRVADTSVADSLAGIAAAVLAAAPERFLLAGLSLGGYVAMEIMRAAPERVLKLALLDTNAHADTPEQSQARARAAELAKAHGMGLVLDAMIPRLVHPSRLGDEPLTGAIRAMGERVGVAGYLRQQAAIMARPDSMTTLAAVRCPTLVLCGREDIGSTPELHAEMAGVIPGARMAVVEECGHLSAIERPHAVTALLRDWVLYA